MNDNNEIIKNPYPYSNIPIRQIKYKAFTKNVEELKDSFKFFLGKNKSSKKVRVKTVNLNTQMSRILTRLATNKKGHNSLIKSFKKNISGKNKRFMSAKEIEKYREKKILILKLIKQKTEKEKAISNTININKYKERYISLKEMKKRKFNGLKYSNLHIGNKTSLNNRGYSNIEFINNNVYEDNNTNINNINRKKNNKWKTKNGFCIRKNNSFLNPYTSKNKDSLILNLKNISDDNDEEDKNNNIKKNDNKKEFSNISLNFNLNNNITHDDKYQMKRKIRIQKLISNVDKYENSYNYYPDDYIIHKNSIDPFIFIKKKNLSQFELNIFDKEENNKFINRRKQIRKIKSNFEPKNKFYQTFTHFQRNNYKLSSKSKDKKGEKTKIIIKKLNIINKGANNRNSNLKTLYKHDNYPKKLSKFFSFDEGKKVNKSMGQQIKNDALEYKKDLGNFMFIDGNFLFAEHLSHIKIGKFNINDF